MVSRFLLLCVVYFSEADPKGSKIITSVITAISAHNCVLQYFLLCSFHQLSVTKSSNKPGSEDSRTELQSVQSWWLWGPTSKEHNLGCSSLKLRVDLLMLCLSSCCLLSVHFESEEVVAVLDILL